jgi:hypothetical protein
VPASGARTVEAATDARGPAFDCFYVYPTVSTEPGPNADLTVQRAELAVAVAQAARFSQVCAVWAPMYRQATLSALASGAAVDPAVISVAYQSLLAAWQDYLAHHNGGRPIIVVGHSQGAAMLVRLLSSAVDPDPSLRGRVVMAIVLGGNVTVPQGGVVGGSFAHIPLCTRLGQTGCVIAYSTFPGQPPAAALFGRPGRGVSLQSGQTATTGVQVACTNPAALGGGDADLHPYFLSATAEPTPPVTTPWVTYPRLYAASCRSSGGATWLNVSTQGAGRPAVSESAGPDWGYHADDVNLALGDLTSDVAAAEATWGAQHP